VNKLALTMATLVSLATVAAAQQAPQVDPSLAQDELPLIYLAEDRATGETPESDRIGATPLPLTMAEMLEGEPNVSPFSLGAAGGFLRAKGSDEVTWFGGVQARLRLGYFAAEASIQFHQNKYENGDVVVTQFPVQLTAFLYIIPLGPIRPYILGGVGWYRTRTDYKGPFSSIPDDHQNIFGEHLGAGAEVFLGPRVSVDADVRYIFLNPTTDQVIGRDFNYWQMTFGLNFMF